MLEGTVGCEGVHHHAVTFTLPNFVDLPLLTYFSFHKDIWIVTADYYVYFYLILLFSLTALLQLINFRWRMPHATSFLSRQHDVTASFLFGAVTASFLFGACTVQTCFRRS